MRARFLIAVLLLGLCTTAQAAYPERPIRFIVPSAPGGSPDVLMRILTNELSKRLGVPIAVINRPGASFIIGTMDIVRARPDGYTLGYGNIVSLAINHGLLPDVPYEVERDLTLISNCLRVSNVLAVNNDLPVRSVRELIEYARKHPDKLAMGSSGNGSTGHLGGELFKSMTGTSILHVPYRGSPQAIQDLMSGQLQLMFDNLSSIGPHVKSGRVRGLAVSSARRSPLFPELPTIAEAGVDGYETVAWGGVIGPAGLPQDIVRRLHREIVAALQSPAVRERYAALDTEVDGGTPEAFRELVRRETPRWAEVIRRADARVD